ncbi:MAG: hypothetical protein LBG19_10690 [Prevotellaceae bacterium]|jgi:hypothetical protein|nr:hypothetical protein [Prevotellaceae bacterium]
MKNSLICLLLCLFGSAAFGQELSIEEQVASYKNSRSDLISKARRLLLDKLIEEDIISVTNVVAYIEESLENEDYVGLYNSEKILLYYYYWTGQYDKVELLMQVVSESAENTVSRKIHPLDDFLYAKLREKTNDQYDFLISLINGKELSSEEKDFLILSLKNILLESRYYDNGFSQEDINVDANLFINSYSNSTYLNTVKKVIRNEYIEGDWSGSIEIYSGYGILSSKLSDTYKNPVPIGFSLSGYYKNVLAQANFSAGFNSLKKDIDYSLGTWTKGEKMRAWNAGVNFGYNVINNKILKIAPIGGIEYMGITVTPKDEEDIPELKEINVKFFSFLIGAT